MKRFRLVKLMSIKDEIPCDYCSYASDQCGINVGTRRIGGRRMTMVFCLNEFLASLASRCEPVDS